MVQGDGLPRTGDGLGGWSPSGGVSMRCHNDGNCAPKRYTGDARPTTETIHFPTQTERLVNIIKHDEVAQKFDQIVNTLDNGGVVCLPCNGKYRLIADLADEDAVMSVTQAKRRISKAPSLVFVADEKMLDQVADDVDPKARQLMRSLWPGPLTIRFDASRDLPRVVRKTLVKATGKVGVRVPDDDLVHRVVERLGRPVYVSSANKENKHGETSPAQIRQNFFGRIELFVDAGDLKPEATSTVVDVKNGSVKVVRQGHVPDEKIAEVTA